MYVNKIVEKTGLNKKDIEDLVEKKKEELKGLISEEGALFIIAKDLGVDVREENKELLSDIDINISDIKANMKNLTLIGRIKDVYNIRNFKRKDGSDGHVSSFLLHDDTGDIRVVLWDDHVNILNDKNFVKNELVKVINGYAKEGIDNKIEVQLGRLGRIILAPEDVDLKKFPKVKDEPVQIGSINLNLRALTLEGKIMQIFPPSEFERKDGGIGRISSIIFMDNTGTIRISFWNEDINKLESCKAGDSLFISGLIPRLNNLDKKTIDLHANRNTIVKKVRKDLQLENNIIEKIEELQKKQNGIVSFKGIVSSIDNLKTISLKTEEVVQLLGFTISDDTDYIRVTLWREKAEEFSKVLKKGAGIYLKDVLIKYSSFSNRNEVSFFSDSSLELIEFKIKNIKLGNNEGNKPKKELTGNYTNISLINTAGIYEVKGFIAKEIKNITIYESCSTCFKKISNCNCEAKSETILRMIVNLIINDESGTIRTTFIGDMAEKIIGVDTVSIFKMKETPDFDLLVEKKSSELLGKDLIIRGRAKYSEFTSSYELIADNFQEMNIMDELKKTVEELGI